MEKSRNEIIENTSWLVAGELSTREIFLQGKKSTFRKKIALVKISHFTVVREHLVMRSPANIIKILLFFISIYGICMCCNTNCSAGIPHYNALILQSNIV